MLSDENEIDFVLPPKSVLDPYPEKEEWRPAGLHMGVLEMKQVKVVDRDTCQVEGDPHVGHTTSDGWCVKAKLKGVASYLLSQSAPGARAVSYKYCTRDTLDRLNRDFHESHAPGVASPEARAHIR